MCSLVDLRSDAVFSMHQDEELRCTHELHLCFVVVLGDRCTGILSILIIVSVSGFLLFKDFCENQCDEPVPQLKFYEEVSLHHRPILPTTSFLRTFMAAIDGFYGIFVEVV